MARYYVTGGAKLHGELEMHGAKNSVLPILAGALLMDETTIHNSPRLTDVAAACDILRYLGCEAAADGNVVTTKTSNLTNCGIPDDLMREMRSSVVFLGAIIGKCGKARISLPGGCELGPRPIDMHIAALERMGVSVEEDGGYLNCTVKQKLRGAVIPLPFPSVGATENIMLAACTAVGDTVIHNAAREPEIEDLAGFLNAAGANISIKENGTVLIRGVKALKSAEYHVIPDRIASATYLCCAAATGGKVVLKGVRPEHLTAVLPVLEEMGCTILSKRDTIELSAPKRLKPARMIRTMPYPGFPTDAQAPVMALSCMASGTSVYVENIFESRYKQTPELARMGAKIKVEGRVAVVEGVRALHGAKVFCTDLRGGACLVTAALGAEGETEINEISHIERGYQDFDKNLSSLGAIIIKR